MKKFLTALLLLGSAAAVAQPSVIISDESASPGGTATVQMDFVADGSTASFDFTFTFDDTNLTGSNCNVSAPPGANGASCNIVGNEVRVIIVPSFPPTALSSATVGTVDFTIDGGVTPGTVFPLTIISENYFDASGGPVTPSGSMDGSVTAAAGPTLDADPAMGTINTDNLSSGNTSSTFTANGGAVGSISCADTGGDSQISFSASPPASLADGESFDVTATCSSGANGTFTNSFSCTSDASNSPTTFDVTCNVSQAAANVSSSPTNGSTVAIGPLTPGSSGSATITFTNTGGTDATVNSCALASGTDFSLGAVPATVPAGGSASLTVNATAPADGTIPTDTLTCDIDGTAFSFGLTIFLEPEVVPTMSQWGLILLTLSIFGLGFWTLRRRGDIA